MRSRLTNRRLVFVCVLSAVFVNEYLLYWIQPWHWPTFPTSYRDLEKNIVILFVSDPQILGYLDEPSCLGYITRWDCDSYLQKSFHLVQAYAKPDVIIFLGDLLDEGSRANDSHYEAMLKRFSSIFQIEDKTQVIYVAGDNDVGGEGKDRRSEFKVSRFEKHFHELVGTTRVGFVEFMKLDIAQNGERDLVARKTAENITKDVIAAPYRILINHERVIRDYKHSIYPILQSVQPQLIVSAHQHRSKYFHCEKCLSETIEGKQWHVKTTNLSDISDFMEINIHETKDINEFMTPTCSYRMGVNDMGYGLAILENSGTLRYTVLWQLDREYVLLSYLLWITVIVILTFRIILRDIILTLKKITMRLLEVSQIAARLRYISRCLLNFLLRCME